MCFQDYEDQEETSLAQDFLAGSKEKIWISIFSGID